MKAIASLSSWIPSSITSLDSIGISGACPKKIPSQAASIDHLSFPRGQKKKSAWFSSCLIFENLDGFHGKAGPEGTMFIPCAGSPYTAQDTEDEMSWGPTIPFLGLGVYQNLARCGRHLLIPSQILRLQSGDFPGLLVLVGRFLDKIGLALMLAVYPCLFHCLMKGWW